MTIIQPIKAEEYLSVLKHTLLGLNCFQATNALNVMVKLHDGLRKDGITPEWAHPVMVTMELLTLNHAWPDDLRDDLYTSAILHDTLEDKFFSRNDLANVTKSRLAFDSIIALSRKEKANPSANRDKETYYRDMEVLPIPPAVKLSDRGRNFDTMIGVFSPEKQLDYVKEAEEYILPMSRRARDKHTHLYWPLQNLHWHLKGQISLIKAIHSSIRDDSSD